MPAPAKSMLPALGAFLACALTYTTVVARKEGQQMDSARTRWQQQHARANKAMSDYGKDLLEQQAKQQEYDQI